VAVTTISASQFDDVGGQPLLVISPRRYAALRRTVLSEHTADPSLGQF
jgi:nitrate reductase cytochrome c-type subunit